MNRIDSTQNTAINVRLTDKLEDTPTFSLTSAVCLFLHDNSRVENSKSDNREGRKTKTAEELRKDSLSPFNKMQQRMLGLKRRAAAHGTPSADYRYHTVYPHKMVSFEKKQERINGLKLHASPPSPRYSMDACYRTIHPKKIVALEKFHDRIDRLEHHDVQRLPTEDLFHRSVHPNTMTMNENVVAVRKNITANKNRIRRELYKQDDMIKTQGRGLQKKYQLIHSDLGKLLRSTPMGGSPCSSTSSSPARFAPSSA